MLDLYFNAWPKIAPSLLVGKVTRVETKMERTRVSKVLQSLNEWHFTVKALTVFPYKLMWVTFLPFPSRLCPTSLLT